ncbi:phosphatase PAP2 family protein [Brachybacterium halotolerans subsp. kimchii]|uniref:phosphatase PAP2 family protein n=1 Tax=Brachybacterium halotolerans TaxID=2795215 RepID=UPI001E36C453|nr:phosphatase PAP2 family protein [Brachybacterium halotolerans]UEJ83831.1 phosphatase PAP2 family protein [Brachybacterium halotolerans subsp. kimchii]
MNDPSAFSAGPSAAPSAVPSAPPATPSSTPSAVRRRALAVAGLGAVLVVLAMAVIGRLINASPAVEALDLSGVRSANSALTPFTSALAVGIDLACGPAGAAPIAALVVVGAWILTRRLRSGFGAGVLIAVPWASAELVKIMVRRQRPDPHVLVRALVPDPPSFSFPSGHTAFAAAICCAIILLLRGRTARTAGVLLGASAVLVTAWSRVALGVHHPTDVVASIVMAPILSLLTARALSVLGVMDVLGARGRSDARGEDDGGAPSAEASIDQPTAQMSGQSRGARHA